jgi:signal transduction histidine kinase
MDSVQHPSKHIVHAIQPSPPDGVWVFVERDLNSYSLERFNGFDWTLIQEFEPTTHFRFPYATLQTSDNTIWMGSVDGTGLSRLLRGQLKLFGPQDGYLGAGTFSIVEKSPGNLWMGDRDDIVSYDGTTWTVMRRGLETVRHLALASDASIWAATGSGVHRFQGESWIDFSEDEGIPDAAAYGVYESRQGRIWVATSLGIRQFRPEHDMDPPITWMDPEANLGLAPPDGDVRFLFSGRDKWQYTPTARLLYSHRLDSGEWSRFEPQTVAAYSGLSPGKHRFGVRAMDRTGNIDPNPAFFDFEVLLPWYQAPSFILTSAGGILLLLLLGRMHFSRHQWLRRSVTDRTRQLTLTNECLQQEVEQRKRMGEQIREQATLLDHAQEAIFVCNLNHRVTYWNRGAERLHGWDSNHALGLSIQDLFPVVQEPQPDMGPASEWCSYGQTAKHRAQSVLDSGEWKGQFQWVSPEGRAQIIDGRWTLVRDGDGEPKAILGIHVDVTEKRRLELQLLRAQRMEGIGTLAGGMAHDLNNVLAPILMSVDLLRMTARSEDELDILERVEKNTRRGADLVQQVLSFARGVAVSKSPVDLRQMHVDILKLIRQTFDLRIKVVSNTEPDLWRILGDPTQIHQLLLNLCLNSRDAMISGGTLTISMSNSGPGVTLPSPASLSDSIDLNQPYVLIEISDTGTGISPSIRHRIFDPFFTTKEVGKGTGLGLATVQSIVNSHNGVIQVQSEENRGTTFRIWLPALQNTLTSTGDTSLPSDGT